MGSVLRCAPISLLQSLQGRPTPNCLASHGTSVSLFTLPEPCWPLTVSWSHQAHWLGLRTAAAGLGISTMVSVPLAILRGWDGRTLGVWKATLPGLPTYVDRARDAFSYAPGLHLPPSSPKGKKLSPCLVAYIGAGLRQRVEASFSSSLPSPLPATHIILKLCYHRVFLYLIQAAPEGVHNSI